MLPFSTKTDLEEAARQGDVSSETRNAFLKTTMCAEHSLPAARAQLAELWSAWLANKYPGSTDEPADAASSFPRAATPTEDTTAAAVAALAAEEAIKKGLEEKSREFVEQGAEVYSKA